jgi:hypothetical protein
VRLLKHVLSISTYIKSPCFHYDKKSSKGWTAENSPIFLSQKILGWQTSKTTCVAHWKIAANQQSFNVRKKKASCGGIKFIGSFKKMTGRPMG